MINAMNFSLFAALLGWISARALYVTAFIVPSEQRSKFSTIRTFTVPSQSTKISVVWDPQNPDSGSEFVEFPTASQKAEIKKEAKKKKARKQMPYFSFSDEETNGPWSDETITAIFKQLAESEMMELRGICRESRRDVFQTAKWFCEDLEDIICPSSDSEDEEEGLEDQEDGGMHLPVALVSTKGHTALIYCPTLPVDHPNKLILRTSVGQKNLWRSRPKAPRDIRGQIIKESKSE
mmetsp:Transcript_7903/g.16974  ORF Transcript_7903/g.16974 Transcript_7903/m.16974 type:complete len:236 (-) Transcript_7903:214-921(-)